MTIFGPKINTFELLSKAVHKIFLKLYSMTGILKWLQVPVLDI